MLPRTSVSQFGPPQKEMRREKTNTSQDPCQSF